MSDALLRIAFLNAGLAALLAVPAALATLLLRRRPAVVHGLWLLVLLKLVTPPLVPVPLGRPGEEPTAPPAVVAELPTCPAALPEVAPGEIEPAEVTPASFEMPVPEEPFDWRTPLTAVWLAGTLVVWGVAWARLRQLSRVLDTLSPASGDIRERVKALCRRLGLRSVPEVWLVPGVVPPLLVARWLPRLLIPARLWERLDDAGRDTLLLHELAHLRRGDGLVRWLELLVVGLFWWYPLAWWASRALRDAEELCCDAWVVWAAPESAAAYADVLVETVAFLSGAPARVSPLASGAAPVRFLHRRLAMILRRPAPRRLSPAALVVLVVGGVCLLPLVPTLAQTPPPVDMPAPAAMSVEDAVKQSPSCRACHQVLGDAIHPKKADAKAGDLHDEILKLMNDLAKKKAAVKKAEDELRDKLRRFEQATGTKPSAPSADRRLDDMEKKLELLLKEMKELKDSRRQRPSPARSSLDHTSADVVHMRQRTFQIPIRIQPDRQNDVKELVLYMSSDEGANWGISGRADPRKSKAFDFHAEQDGLYYINVATIDKRGQQEPADPTKAPVGMKVVVDTTRPEIEMSVSKDVGRVVVRWRIIEQHPKLDSLKLDYQLVGDDNWTRVPVERRVKGDLSFSPDGAVAQVRMRVSDLAGNEVESKVKLAWSPIKAITDLLRN